MNTYLLLIIVLFACLLAATSILYEQLTGLDQTFTEKFEKLDRELNQ